jgi:hypothetical protein
MLAHRLDHLQGQSEVVRLSHEIIQSQAQGSQVTEGYFRYSPSRMTARNASCSLSSGKIQPFCYKPTQSALKKIC